MFLTTKQLNFQEKFQAYILKIFPTRYKNNFYVKNKEYFEITENEKNAAEKIGDDYFIYQVTSALTNPVISSIIQNPIKYVQQNKVLMEPLVYRVSYKNRQ